jgi:hypothetical protein
MKCPQIAQAHTTKKLCGRRQLESYTNLFICPGSIRRQLQQSFVELDDGGVQEPLGPDIFEVPGLASIEESAKH